MRAAIMAMAIAAASLPTAAMAESWYRVGNNSDQVSYVDLDSIRQGKTGRVANTESVFAQPVSGNIYAARVLTEYDCAGNQLRTIEYSYYDRAGRLMNTEPSETIDREVTPSPNSLNALMLAFACSGKGGQLVADPMADGRAMLGR